MRTKTIKNTPGMFDAFKGFMMIAIIAGHSVSAFFPYWEVDFSKSPIMFIFGSMISFFNHSAIPVFFMICGYGVRKMTVKSAFKKQFGYLLKPYLLITLAVAVTTIARVFLLKTDLLEKLAYYVLPYLLAYCGASGTILGVSVNTIGPVWFVWVYFVAAIVMNLILQEDELWMQVFLITVLSLFGLALREIPLPFCLHQVAICSGYMYFGWLIKKKKIMQQEIPARFWWIAFAAGLTLSAFGNMEVSMNQYSDGATDLLVSYLCGFLVMYFCVRLNEVDNALWHGIAWMGRKALIICCMHTVTYIIIPWQKIAEVMESRKLLGVVLCVAVHFTFAVGGTMLLDLVKRKKAKQLVA